MILRMRLYSVRVDASCTLPRMFHAISAKNRYTMHPVDYNGNIRTDYDFRNSQIGSWDESQENDEGYDFMYWDVMAYSSYRNQFDPNDSHVRNILNWAHSIARRGLITCVQYSYTCDGKYETKLYCPDKTLLAKFEALQ